MKFKLLIECTKDIDELSINFTDGTSMVKETQSTKPTKPTKPTKHSVKKQTSNVVEPSVSNSTHKPKCDNNWFEETPAVDSTKVSLPKIELPERKDVKIAKELQNLDI